MKFWLLILAIVGFAIESHLNGPACTDGSPNGCLSMKDQK